MKWTNAGVKNPDKEGTYLVTLEYNRWVDGKMTDEIENEVDVRWFDGEDWADQCGSILGERVMAWMVLPGAYKGDE